MCCCSAAMLLLTLTNLSMPSTKWFRLEKVLLMSSSSSESNSPMYNDECGERTGKRKARATSSWNRGLLTSRIGLVAATESSKITTEYTSFSKPAKSMLASPSVSSSSTFNTPSDADSGRK